MNPVVLPKENMDINNIVLMSNAERTSSYSDYARDKTEVALEGKKNEIIDAASVFRDQIDVRLWSMFEKDGLFSWNSSEIPGALMYPIGCCHIIASVWEQILRSTMNLHPKILTSHDIMIARLIEEGVSGNWIEKAAYDLWSILEPVFQYGVEPRRIFWTVNGMFVQNILEIGAYHLDIATDTVEGTKQKVIFSHDSESEFRDFRSYEDIADIIERYWWVEVFPNTAFPEIAPMYPIIYKNKVWKFFFLPMSFRFFDTINNFESAEYFLKTSHFSHRVSPESILLWWDELFQMLLKLVRKGVFSWVKEPFTFWRDALQKARCGDHNVLQNLSSSATQIITWFNASQGN